MLHQIYCLVLGLADGDGLLAISLLLPHLLHLVVDHGAHTEQYRASVILRKFYLKYSFNTVSVHRVYLLSITDRFTLIYFQHSCCLLLI